MKKAVCAFLSILMLISFAGCTNTCEIELSKYINTGNLTLSGIKISGEAESMAVYKNIAFALGNGKITRYDISSGSSEVILEDSSALAIGCSGSRIAVVNDSSVGVYDYDGKELSKIPFDYKISEVTDVTVNEKYVVFASHESSGDVIYRADASKDKVEALTDDWKLGNDDVVVKSISLTSDSLLNISYCYNLRFEGSDFKILEYNVSKNTIVYSSDQTDLMQDGCFGTDGEFYYIDEYQPATKTDFALHQFITKIPKDGTAENVMLVDNEGLKELGIEPINIITNEYSVPGGGTQTTTIIADNYILEYSDSTNFVIWNKTAGTLAAFSKGSEIKPLVLIIPDDKANDNEIKDLIIEYTALTGREITVKSYPADNYNKQILTKIMAEDSDFDLFISDEVMLNSILEHSAYESLDGYQEIVSNFDNVYAAGVKDLMTADNGLFGIPLDIMLSGPLEMLDSSYSMPDYPKLDDLFALCDSLEGSGKKVFNERALLRHTTKNLVEEMIQQDGEIDTKELTEYFSKLKSYNDMGVLCDGDNEHIMFWGTIMFEYSDSLFESNRVDQRDVMTAPIAGDTQYLTLYSTMLINRFSENKDAAAELLELLSSEETVYSNDNLIIGKDVSKYAWYENLSENEKEHVNFVLKVYENSKPAKLGVIEDFIQYIDEVINQLFDGEIDPQQASENISSKVSYVYFE